MGAYSFSFPSHTDSVLYSSEAICRLVTNSFGVQMKPHTIPVYNYDDCASIHSKYIFLHVTYSADT